MLFLRLQLSRRKSKLGQRDVELVLRKSGEWMSTKEIWEKTDLSFNSIFSSLKKLFEVGEIEKKVINGKGQGYKSNLWKIKKEHPGK